MSDPRLNSGHLELPRRQEYRRCKQALLDARGLLTLVGEHVANALADPELWPVRPNRMLPGERYLLIDPRAGWVHQLKTGLNTLGRLPNNDVTFEENSISRRHCVILLHVRGGCEIHDTASRNGTFVNGVRVVRAVRLESGDCITISRTRLLFRSEQDYDAQCVAEEHPATVLN